MPINVVKAPTSERLHVYSRGL